MVPTRKKKQKKWKLSQFAETLNNFVLGNSVSVNVSESKKLEQQTKGQFNDFEKFENSARQKSSHRE